MHQSEWELLFRDGTAGCADALPPSLRLLLTIVSVCCTAGAAAAGVSSGEAVPEEADRQAASHDPAGADICDTGTQRADTRLCALSACANCATGLLLAF
jgi:hypothetical protein